MGLAMSLTMHTKTIWITGASSGIGRALALALLTQGHYLIVSGRSLTSLRELRLECPERVSIVDFDLSDDSAMKAVERRLEDITDSLDMVVLAAGVCEYVDTASCSEALYRRVMEINYFAQIRCFLVALPMLRRSEHRAQIVGIGSLSAYLPLPRAQAYGASKAAFEYWMDSMRIDLHAENIDVTLVSPGFVDTPLTRKNDFAMPALITVERAAEIILRAVGRSVRHLRFPKRLYWALSLMASLERAWFGLVAPRLSRGQKL